jgi:hypothetical protein
MGKYIDCKQFKATTAILLPRSKQPGPGCSNRSMKRPVVLKRFSWYAAIRIKKISYKTMKNVLLLSDWPMLDFQ